MQAITVAIGKTGINFFAQQLVANELVSLLAGLKPPAKSISLGTIDVIYSTAANVVINLTNGSLVSFSPAFQSVTQQSGGSFPLVMQASNFSAQYNWEETYVWTSCSLVMGMIICQDPVNKDNKFTYAPAFSSLTVNVPLQFEYDSQNQTWSIAAGTSSGSAVASSANIPSGSILQEEDQECFSSHVDDATASAISAIDFGTPLNSLIAGTIASIPGSGNLGNGMIYDFSLGDAGLLFPNNDGIQMGVKGGASYNGTPFSGGTPPSLPLPVPPTDSDAHHLNMYVSNYEIDALNWAFYEAGKLNMVITPQELPDPQLLNVSSYTSYEQALLPYSAFVMNAAIVQNSAPVTSFETVYVYTKQAMALLQSQLPAAVYTLIQALPSNAYTSQADVDAFLTEATVPQTYFTQIEDAGKIAGMVLTQDITYTLTIQNNAVPAPNIVFTTKRTDVLVNLGLGISTNNAQSLQFDFSNANNSVSYVSSSIPEFNGPLFESIVWVIAESLYAQNMQNVGKTGVPLPIMQDFQFDFTNADLSVQNGYVSILANVLYKKS